MAKPTKEDKIRRKAKKTQRKSDKQRAGGVRRDHDGIGKRIDSTEIRNPKTTSANRLPESKERTEGWKPQKVWGCRGMLQCDDDRDRPGPLRASFLANGPRAGSPLDLLKTNEVRAAAPSQSPLHAHEFYGCARHGRASALTERPAFASSQCFRQSLGSALRECRPTNAAHIIVTAYTMSSYISARWVSASLTKTP